MCLARFRIFYGQSDQWGFIQTCKPYKTSLYLITLNVILLEVWTKNSPLEIWSFSSISEEVQNAILLKHSFPL